MQSSKKERLIPTCSNSKNLLLKLIKIDEKNTGNTHSVSSKFRKKQPELAKNDLKEAHLKLFWNYVNDSYFKKIEQTEKSSLDELFDNCKEEFDGKTNKKYFDSKSYETVKNILSKNYKNLYVNPEFSKLNYQNFLKQYWVSLKFSKLINPNIKKIDNFVKTNRYIYAQNFTSFKNYLLEEQNQLDKYINFVESNDKINNLSEIDLETQKLEKEFQIQKQNNILEIQNLKGKIHHASPQHNDSKILFEYLELLILKLEKKIVAESISKITSIEKENGIAKYKIYFEDTISNPVLVDSAKIEDLDKLRENSFFSIYMIPQKTPYSLISQNFFCFDKIFKSHNKDICLKGGNYIPLLKKNGFNNKTAKALDKFFICHHCKNLFNENFLVKCKYNSSIMGFPIINTSELKILALHKEKLKRQRKKSLKLLEEDDEIEETKKIICNRKFCFSCLKQNYDQIIPLHINKICWICPHCQGICYCTQCLNNDMILKLKSFFLQNGGSYLSLPNAFDLKKKKSFDKNEKNSEKETLKEIQSKNIETVQLKKKQLEKTKKSYLAIKYPEFELRKKELKDLKKRKRNEKEMTLLYRPIQKIKKI